MANQNVTQLTQQSGSASLTSLFYAVTGGTTDTGLPLSVFVNNLGLTGTPTVPTATTGTNTTQIASTAFVQAQLTSTLAAYAVLNGPTFTGNMTLNTGGTNPLFTIANGTTSVDLVNNSTNGTYGWFNVTTGHQAEVFNSTTDQATFFTRPIFGAATPWDSANLNFTTPPAIGATTPNTGAFTTLSATGVITPSTTNGIKGTTLADNAIAGSVGEFISGTGTAVALTSGSGVNVTSISLTAGDWDVSGNAIFIANSTTIGTSWSLGVSLVSATSPAGGSGQRVTLQIPQNTTVAVLEELTTPSFRVNVSTTTTVYLVAQPAFTVSTMTATGVLRARRVR